LVDSVESMVMHGLANPRLVVSDLLIEVVKSTFEQSNPLTM
jgi:hypothetical protein